MNEDSDYVTWTLNKVYDKTFETKFIHSLENVKKKSWNIQPVRYILIHVSFHLKEWVNEQFIC